MSKLNSDRVSLLKKTSTHYRTENKTRKAQKFINHFKNKEQ